MSVLEINTSAYELLELRHEINRASVLRFRTIVGLFDSEALPDRTEVKFTVDGVCWFYGRTLPVKRYTQHSLEYFEYIAADPLEFLGHNPVANDGDGVNQWYNRKSVDVSAYPYPTNYSIQDIIEAELDDVAGVGKDFAGFDFSNAGSASDIVPLDFEAKGKSRLGVVDALTNESPSLAYWYDPTTYNESDDLKGTLRFYNLAEVPDTPTQDIVLPYRLPEDSSPLKANCVRCDINEDISASYDTLVLHGWGDMQETVERPLRDWDSLPSVAIGNDMPFLRRNSSGEVEYYDHTSGPNGAWVSERMKLVRPYFPESDAPGYHEAFRRYSTEFDIADVRLGPRGTASPIQYARQTQSMWVSRCQNVWNIGASFRVGSAYYDVQLFANSTRIGAFGPNTAVDNDGDVVPNSALYPNYPTINDTDPLFPVPTPSVYERDRFVLKDPLVRRTEYLFTGNASGNSGYNNLVNQPCFKYWPADFGLTMRYTAQTQLSVTRSDVGLGYNKRLDLYDERFFRYADKDDNVLRDDTSLMDAVVDAIWPLVKRKRCYGEAEIYVPPTGELLSDWMCAGARIFNYGEDAGERTIPAFVQAVDLSQLLSKHTLVVRFDRENTFRPLNTYLMGREFFDNAVETGLSKLGGKTGNRLNPAGQGGPKRPLQTGTGQEVSELSTTLAVTPKEREVVMRGVITSRNTSVGTSVNDPNDPECVKYGAQTIDGEYETPEQQIPALRQFDFLTPIWAAEVNSPCLIAIVPKDGEPGFEVQLLVVNERLRQYLIAGRIVETYVDNVPSTTPARPLSIDYDWETTDGVFNGQRDYPLYRPYNNNPEVIPAAVGSSCTVLVTGDVTGYEAKLWSVGEKLNFDECGPSGLYQYTEGGSEFDSSYVVVAESGEEVFDDDGNLILSGDAPEYANAPEERIVVSLEGGAVYDENGDVVLSGDNTNSGTSVLDPLYAAKLFISSVTYSTVVEVVNYSVARPVPPSDPGSDT